MRSAAEHAIRRPGRARPLATDATPGRREGRGAQSINLDLHQPVRCEPRPRPLSHRAPQSPASHPLIRRQDFDERSNPAPLRLTEFSHGGGCGCKIAPARAAGDPGGRPRPRCPTALLVGVETSDDAAVYQLNERQAMVATTDFFMPIVDDPFDFGAIAATNAISDVYAMGGTPLFALALVGMPVDKLPVETIRRILEGGEAVCATAGIPIAGGHTIDSVEPIYGLVVIGVVDPRTSSATPARAGRRAHPRQAARRRRLQRRVQEKSSRPTATRRCSPARRSSTRRASRSARCPRSTR